MAKAEARVGWCMDTRGGHRHLQSSLVVSRQLMGRSGPTKPPRAEGPAHMGFAWGTWAEQQLHAGQPSGLAHVLWESDHSVFDALLGSAALPV